MKTFDYLIPGFMLILLAPAVQAQVRAVDLSTLQQMAEKEGWTFSVGKNDATERPMDELCGLAEPPGWQKAARFATPRKLSGTLPSSFDWRTSGLTPVKNQGNCGSCWAFATVGCLENAIKLKEGVTVDLSEQWLVSCNRSSWGCNGGWFAHAYHLSSGGSSDSFGGNGAVLESEFPYTATDSSCNGPYTHAYWINDWAYLAGASSVPSVALIKQAIMTYGPISVGVYVSSAFQSYTSGVFNRNEDRNVNHAVVLVGWDDNQGANGVWILRNSWGSGWGENGYMRIEYGCCRVGYAACYVDYRPVSGLRITPADSLSASGPVGGPFTPATQTYTLLNNSSVSVPWTASHAQPWLDVAPAYGTLAAGQSVDVVATIQAAANSLANGAYADIVTFTNRGSGVAETRTVTLRCGQMDYLTELFSAGDNDLANRSFTFTPNGSSAYYGVTRAAATAFPTDPAGGTAVTLSDDGYYQIMLSGGARVSLFGIAYSAFYIGANGYLTFGGYDTAWTETPVNHFNRPRISALFDDLNPTAGGTVSWRQLADRVAVTWRSIREYNAAAANDFQVECFFNGTIRITYLGLAARDGLAGLSRGSGAPSDFVESDFSAYPLAPAATGALQVGLSPAEAVAAGAQWRVDGGAWQDADAVLADLAAGEHTLAFKGVAGYATPADQAVTVVAGRTTEASGVYVSSAIGLGEALDQPSWNWSTDAGAPWMGQGKVSYDGTDAAQSGALGDDDRSVVETAVTGPGTLNFWWKVSSEPDSDFLSFAVDGSELSGAISGEQDWRQVSVTLPAGAHTLTWAYTKDAVSADGEDVGWVDQVSFTSAASVNLALASRGSTISGNNGANWKKLIDGSTSYSKRSGYGYTIWRKAKPAPGKMVLDLKSVCTIDRMRLLLYSLDKRYHKYLIEASANGSSWVKVVDRTRVNCRGWQELVLSAPVEARYLRLTGTYCSIGNYFMAAEWQVFGLVGRYAAVRTVSSQPAVAAVASAPAPADVITSGGKADYPNGRLAVDGNAQTAWSGNPASGGCWMALVYDRPIRVSGIYFDMAPGCSTNVLLKGSMDALYWYDVRDAWQNGPVKLQYVWLIFPQPDPKAQAPEVREIDVRR